MPLSRSACLIVFVIVAPRSSCFILEIVKRDDLYDI